MDRRKKYRSARSQLKAQPGELCLILDAYLRPRPPPSFVRESLLRESLSRELLPREDEDPELDDELPEPDERPEPEFDTPKFDDPLERGV